MQDKVTLSWLPELEETQEAVTELGYDNVLFPFLLLVAGVLGAMMVLLIETTLKKFPSSHAVGRGKSKLAMAQKGQESVRILKK